ncbi:MAG: penicillin-binding protein 2 [Actinomycetota bacterium]|nr:penicillin-binding protein 2 [Actinomycetota bacterium]
MARMRGNGSRDASSPEVSSSRGPWVWTFFIALAALLLLRLFYVQVIRHGSYSESASYQHSGKTLTLPARRGTIYDRNGTVLATTVECRTISADPSQIDDVQDAVDKLAPLLVEADGIPLNDDSDGAITSPVPTPTPTPTPEDGEDGEETPSPTPTPVDRETAIASKREELFGLLADKESRFCYVKRQCDLEIAEQIMELDIKGLVFTPDYKRVFPNGATAVQVVGLLNSDGEALSGLEAQYDDVLRGTDGSRQVETVHGSDVPIEGGKAEQVDPVDGHDIVCTIDLELQRHAEQCLADYVETCGAEGGNVVLYDAATGEIYACASAPLPDPGDVRNSDDVTKRCTAVTYAFEPGSTFKAVTAAAALNEDKVEIDTMFDVPSELPVYDVIIRDDDTHGDLHISLTQIIERSSNIGIDLVERTIGDETFYNYMKAFGFGESCGVDFPGEATGLLAEPSQWNGVTGQNLPFGQGLSANSLQMARAFGVFANEGVMCTPHFLLSKPGSDETIDWPTSQPVSAQTAEEVTYMLEQVVANGTGKTAKVYGYTAAGKTATAQYLDEETGTYTKSKSNVGFIGYLPNTSSKLVCSVSIYNAGPGTKGTWTFSQVMSYVAKHMKLAPA